MFKALNILPKKLALLVTVAFIFGALAAFWARFVFVDQVQVHYHANFALYVNGERDEFSNFTFYEEVAACSSDHENDPRTRVHMHDSKNSVVHVHAPGVTWGHFFANLGYVLGNNILETSSGDYVDGQSGELNFILNGQSVESIANEVINSEDTLLIDFSNDDQATLKNRYGSIIRDADEYNHRLDPAACAGAADGESFGDRVKRTLGIN